MGRKMNEVIIGRVYRHYKGDYYLVEGIALHTETEEEMGVYRALYGNCELFVRPKDLFLRKIDKEKYPDTEQEYAFELQNIESLNTTHKK